MQPAEPQVDLRTEHAEALCRVALSPLRVAAFALGSSVASSFFALPFDVAAHALSQGEVLLSLGLIQRPFTGIWDALRHMIGVSGGLRKMIRSARALKFAWSALSPTQPVIFTMKEMYLRIWKLPLHPLYVPPQSNNVWAQWMVPHYLSGGLAGLSFSAVLHLSVKIDAFRDTKELLGARVPVTLGPDGFGRPSPMVGAALPAKFWITAIPFTVHRTLYHGTYDSLAPRNPLGALALGLAVSFLSSAVADGAHNITRSLSGHRKFERHGFAATPKARFVRAIPGALALVFFDQSRRLYCIWKSAPPA